MFKEHPSMFFVIFFIIMMKSKKTSVPGGLTEPKNGLPTTPAPICAKL
jgi:hypothetical protein